jgi:hypothetical protein
LRVELAPIPLPIGRLVAAQFLDTVVHTWDLASALGERYEPPGDVAGSSGVKGESVAGVSAITPVRAAVRPRRACAPSAAS